MLKPCFLSPLYGVFLYFIAVQLLICLFFMWIDNISWCTLHVGIVSTCRLWKLIYKIMRNKIMQIVPVKIGKITTPTVIQQCQSNWTTSPFFRRYIGVASHHNTIFLLKLVFLSNKITIQIYWGEGEGRGIMRICLFGEWNFELQLLKLYLMVLSQDYQYRFLLELFLVFYIWES